MTNAQNVVEELLALCGVRINGTNPWDVQVHDERFYMRVLRDKNLGLGESYMEGWWDCPRVDELICRILKDRIDQKVHGSLKLMVPVALALLTNRQSKTRSQEVAERHYNIGNDLFLSFLDKNHQYSCAYFSDSDDLEQAQRNKMDLICNKLELEGSDRVLDIGFGWGGLAKHMARAYGCQVTGVNIAEEQVSFAKDSCKDLSVEILLADYRDVQGTFDKIVSVGMFEHVGRKNYRTFMEVAHRCLKDDGVFLLHTIGSNESQIESDRWIAKYIFPNGELPSIAQVSKSVEGLFVMEDLHNLGPHYDKTLMAWHDRFQEAWPRLENAYDERFKRMWEYYLLSCAGAFRARDIQLWQFLFTKRGTRQPQFRN